MTTYTTTRMMSCYGDTRETTVNLPTIPGITITPERPETAPTAPIIRANRRKVSPGGVAIVAAAQRRLGWFVDELSAAREAVE